MKTVYIYTLSDPRTNEVRYVGKTNNPEQRRKAHGVLSREVKSRKKNWIRQLKSLDLRPVFEIIDEVPESEWHKWERYWIQQFIVWGFRLTNHTAGGDGLTIGNQTSFIAGQGRKAVVELDLNGCVIKHYDSVKSLPSGGFVIDKKGKLTKRNTVLLFEETFNRLSKNDIIDYIKEGIEIRVKNEKLRLQNAIKNGGFQNGNSKAWNKGKTYRRFGYPVYQYDRLTGFFIKEYRDSIEAATYFNCASSNIQNCARMVSKTAVGFIWSYEKKDSVAPVSYRSKTWNTINNKINTND